MAVGKNKRLSKGKKGKGKKVIDPFTKKEWYDIKAPSNFSVRACGKTPVTRTTGTKIASEMLKGRVFEICLADLNKDEDQAYRKIKLQCEEVQGKYCLTQFYGLDFTTDKIRSMVRKWQSLIEAFVDVKTTVRPRSPRPRHLLGRAAPPPPRRRRAPPPSPSRAVRSPLPPRRSALTGRVRDASLRDRLHEEAAEPAQEDVLRVGGAAEAHPQEDARDHAGEIIATHDAPRTPLPPSLPLADSPSPLLPPSPQREASTVTLSELVNKFIPEVIGKEIEKACHGFYPLQNCHIRKVSHRPRPPPSSPPPPRLPRSPPPLAIPPFIRSRC